MLNLPPQESQRQICEMQSMFRQKLLRRCLKLRIKLLLYRMLLLLFLMRLKEMLNLQNAGREFGSHSFLMGRGIILRQI